MAYNRTTIYFQHIFTNPKRNPIPISSQCPFPPTQPLGTADFLSVSINTDACSGHFI